MNTDIRFLNELEEDLMEAAWRESVGRALLALAGTVAFLALAAATGFVVLGGPGGASRQLRAEGVPAGPESRNAVEAPTGQQADLVRMAGLLPSSADEASSALERNTLTEQAATDWEAISGPMPALATTTVPGDLTRIVKTAELSVVVDRDTFQDAFRTASLVASQNRGYVQVSSTTGTRLGKLTIRVPASRFDLAVNALAGLGRVESQSVEGQNVSSQFVDLNARLHVWQLQRKVLEGLLTDATSPEQTIRYQNLIQDVLFRVEQIKGELRVLRDQTDMSTIKVSLRDEGAAVPTKHAEIAKPDLGNAVQHALAGFLGVLFAVVVGLGYLVPVSILLALGALVFLRAARRRRVVA